MYIDYLAKNAALQPQQNFSTWEQVSITGQKKNAINFAISMLRDIIGALVFRKEALGYGLFCAF